MIPLFPLNDIDIISSKKILPLKCERCFCVFHATAKYIKSTIKLGRSRLNYCSDMCKFAALNKQLETICSFCKSKLKIKQNQYKKSKSGNHFCSHSCAAKYNNIHKTTGTRRSKLEQWLELALTTKYTNLEFIFNGKETIKSELDIYIPKLKLAFEMNGIFHYEAIFGPDKLASIQNNDGRKFQACLEKGIELVIIDTSSQKYFKATSAQKFLLLISNIIDQKL